MLSWHDAWVGGWNAVILFLTAILVVIIVAAVIALVVGIICGTAMLYLRTADYIRKLRKERHARTITRDS